MRVGFRLFDYATCARTSLPIHTAPVFPFLTPFIRWADVAHLVGQGNTMRRIYDHEFVLCVGGSGHIVIEGRKHDAVTNRLFLVQPRHWHSYVPAGDELLLLGIHFDWTPQHDTMRFPIFRHTNEAQPEEGLFRSPREVPHWDMARNPYLDLDARSRVRRMLESVVAEYSLGDEFAIAGAGGLLAAAIVQISREALRMQMQRAGASVGADALRRVERARKLLEDTESLHAIDEAAESVGWSPDHLRRMFRRTLGTSPQSVQMIARLSFARELLRAGDIPVNEVAARVGFDDASHFSRVFKADGGLTPREFQALARRT